MHILVNARHLGDSELSGVGQYTVEVLREAFLQFPELEWTLVTSGLAIPDLTRCFGTLPDHVHHRHIPLPNKLLSLAHAITGDLRLDRLVPGAYDAAWFPNLDLATVSPALPLTLTIHDMSWSMFPDLYSVKMRLWHRLTRPHKLIGRAASILVPSKATAQDVVRVSSPPPERVHVVPHGVRPIFSSRMQAQDHGVRSRLHLPKRFALFLGTLEPRKNLLATLIAFKAFRERSRTDLHLVLAGGWGWNAHDLRNAVREAQQEGWLTHLGYVADKDRPALYRAAELFLFPSWYEGFGLPPLEAMASGTPVIASHTGSLGEVVGSAGILVDPSNPGDITEALLALAGDQPFQARLAKAGLNRASQFTWQQAAREAVRVLRQEAGGRRQGG